MTDAIDAAAQRGSAIPADDLTRSLAVAGPDDAGTRYAIGHDPDRRQ